MAGLGGTAAFAIPKRLVPRSPEVSRGDQYGSLAAVLQCSKRLSHRVDAGGRGCPNGTRSPSLPEDSDLTPGTASGMSDGMIERIRRP